MPESAFWGEGCHGRGWAKATDCNTIFKSYNSIPGALTCCPLRVQASLNLTRTILLLILNGVPKSLEERLFKKLRHLCLEIIIYASVNIHCACVVYTKIFRETNFRITFNLVRVGKHLYLM